MEWIRDRFVHTVEPVTRTRIDASVRDLGTAVVDHDLRDSSVHAAARGPRPGISPPPADIDPGIGRLVIQCRRLLRTEAQPRSTVSGSGCLSHTTMPAATGARSSTTIAVRLALAPQSVRPTPRHRSALRGRAISAVR